MGYSIAIVGATGNVGRELLAIIAERAFPADRVAALASRASKGVALSFGERQISVEALEDFSFAGIDIALFAAGSDIARQHAPRAARAGAIVIDNSSLYRYDADVPLIVPEVNPDAVGECVRRNIIANPNCSTAQMVVALKPLHQHAPIGRVVVSTYQSVSGAGKAAMDELWTQTRGIFVSNPPEARHFTKQIAFNVIPHIDVFLDDGSTREEWKMAAETKKIIDPKIRVHATCVRVPVFVGHSEAVNVSFKAPMDAEKARRILRGAPGIALLDRREDGGYVTPVDAVGEYATYISRLRDDPTCDNAISFWCVSDNLRKGAALNAVQIAELVGRRILKKG